MACAAACPSTGKPVDGADMIDGGADQKILHTNTLIPECPRGPSVQKIQQLGKEEMELETRRAAEKP